MGIDQVMQMLNGKTEIKLVKFISDKGPNSCKECLKHHGEVFRADDSNKPELPIHPNCRCKYELLSQKDEVRYQENIKKSNPNSLIMADSLQPKRLNYWQNAKKR